MLGGTAAASSRTKLRMSTERSLGILYLSFCQLSCRGVFTVLSVSIFYFFSRQSFQRSASPFRPLLLWTGCIGTGRPLYGTTVVSANSAARGEPLVSGMPVAVSAA